MAQNSSYMNRREASYSVLFICAQFLIIPTAVGFLSEVLSTPLSLLMQNFLCYALNFLLATVMFHRFWLRSLKELADRSFSMLLSILLFLGLYYLTTFLINLLIASLMPSFFNSNDANIAKMASDSRLLMIVSVVILVPPVEEVIFRGIAFGRLYDKSPVLAYTVSVAAFSAIHILGYIGTAPSLQLLLSFLQYIPAGCCLAAVYARTKSIFAPIIMHAIINFIGIMSI